MLIQHSTHRVIHGFLAFLFVFVILLCAAPTAQAEPTDEVVTGWVDIQAHVPEGFKGSVSVLLENKTTGETHIVTSYYLNDYANSVQIPLGEYIVVSAFTSEDSFIYEASTKTEQFTLKDGFDIVVTVTHNPEGEGILADLNGEPVEAPETTGKPASESVNSAPTEETAESTDSDSNSEQDEETTDLEETETPDVEKNEDSRGDVIAKTVRNILLTLAATLAFLLGTILLVVYVRFKFGSD